MPALFIGTSGCAVVMTDQIWWVDKGEDGAVGYHTLTSEEEKANKKDWDSIRFGMACGVATNLTDIKKWTEELCAQAHTCRYVIPTALMAFFEKIEQHNIAMQSR